jgi:1,4-dihydroxy-2-naphthoate octaprenyltransferase
MDRLYDLLDDHLTMGGARRWTHAIIALRPHFLLGGFALYTIGYLYAEGTDLPTYLLGVVSIILLQLSGGLVNDYADAGKDDPLARTWVSGGSGIADTLMVPRRVLLLSILSLLAAVAAILIVALLIGDRPLLAPAVLLGGLGGWAYSLPPRLASTGLGEAWVAFLMGFMIPSVAIYQVTGGLPSEPIPLVALTLLCFTFLVGVSFPDWRTDRAVGKRNLLQRAGIRPTGSVMVISVAFAYALFFSSDLVLGAALLIFSLYFIILMVLALLQLRRYDPDVARRVSGSAALALISSLLVLLLYGLGKAI